MALWIASRPLVLASRSAVRRTLLTDAGVPVEVDPADIDERELEQQASPGDDGSGTAALLAAVKARTVAARRGWCLVQTRP
jgi:septum formation protein